MLSVFPPAAKLKEPSMTTTSITTAEQLWEHHPDGRCELVRGELRMMTPPGSEHGWIVSKIAAPLHSFVTQKKLGYVLTGDSGFIIQRNPDSVRAPDVAFVRRERFRKRPPKAYFEGHPDLAIEVLSPGESSAEVREKTEDWLRSGCSEVWLVDPKREIASRCTRSGDSMVQTNVDRLTTPLLPGFELVVEELFEELE
jgi:Uma2 family endonuclease